MKNISIWLLVLFLFVDVGCTDATLAKVSQALNDTQLAVGGLQSIVIVANKQGTMNDADTQKILSICAKVNSAGIQAVAITRGVSKLAPADRSNISNILTPVVTAVGDSLTSLGITDPKISNDVRAALLAIQTGLTTAQLVLSGGK